MVTENEEKQPSERIAKRIAAAGLCSRRDAERWIETGRVYVNGKKVTTPAFTVTQDDKIQVDGVGLPKTEATRLWIFHKPTGLLTTTRDEKERPTVFSVLPKDLPRVMTIGRLDMHSEGLLLLTNSGPLKRHLELPSTGWKRHYRVRAHGRPSESLMQKLQKGVTIEGVHYGAMGAEIERADASNCWLSLTLTEGKNREIRKVLEHFGLTVNRLIRTSYGSFQLGSLPRGEIREVPAKTLKSLLGEKWV